MWLCNARYLNQGQILRKISSSPWLLLPYSPYYESSGKKIKATPLQERRMIDRFRLHVKGGDGGAGNASIRRSRTNQYGKPDGGKGGRGGDVILLCNSGIWDFRGLQHHINGKKGGNGASKNQIGSRGEDKVVQVPVGTVIHLAKGEIPSSIEDSTCGTHPWESSGTVTYDFPATNKQSSSISHKQEDAGHFSSFYTNDAAEKSYLTKSYAHKSSVRAGSPPSLARGKSTNCEKKPLPDYHDENYCRSMAAYGRDVEIVDGISEDLEEDVEVIQYNVAELTEHGQQIVVARGGEGGLGSVSSFGRQRKNSLRDMNHSCGVIDDYEDCNDENQTSVRAGLPGSEAVMILELKSIADVGLVGMPNAGKSTLLGAISKAQPTIGHYAFTTLRPNLGKLNYDEVSITVADIPGLIKGAHENRGLGHAFLRHIERTKVLAYVVDLVAALDDRKGIPPWEQLRDLVSELEYYQEGLADRPSIVVANKIDEDGAENVLEELRQRVDGIPIYPVCAVLEEGVPELKDALRLLVNGEEPGRLKLENIRIG